MVTNTRENGDAVLGRTTCLHTTVGRLGLAVAQMGLGRSGHSTCCRSATGQGAPLPLLPCTLFPMPSPVWPPLPLLPSAHVWARPYCAELLPQHRVRSAALRPCLACPGRLLPRDMAVSVAAAFPHVPEPHRDNRTFLLPLSPLSASRRARAASLPSLVISIRCDATINSPEQGYRRLIHRI